MRGTSRGDNDDLYHAAPDHNHNEDNFWSLIARQGALLQRRLLQQHLRLHLLQQLLQQLLQHLLQQLLLYPLFVFA